MNSEAERFRAFANEEIRSRLEQLAHQIDQSGRFRESEITMTSAAKRSASMCRRTERAFPSSLIFRGPSYVDRDRIEALIEGPPAITDLFKSGPPDTVAVIEDAIRIFTKQIEFSA